MVLAARKKIELGESFQVRKGTLSPLDSVLFLDLSIEVSGDRVPFPT